MPLKASGMHAWATGCSRPVADHGHARALGGVPGLHALSRGEDLRAEALPEAARGHGLEVGRRHPAVGGEAQVLVLLVLEEDPGGLDREADAEAVQGGVEDGLDVILLVEAGREVREHGQLPAARLHRPLERLDALRELRSLPLTTWRSRGPRHATVVRQILRHPPPS